MLYCPVCFMLLSRSLFGVTLFSFFFYFCQLTRAPKPAGQPMLLSLPRPHLQTHAHMHMHIHMHSTQHTTNTLTNTNTHTHTHSYPYPVTQQIGIGVFGPGWVRPCPRNWPTSWRWQRQRKRCCRYRCSASSSLQSCSFHSCRCCRSCFLYLQRLLGPQQKQRMRRWLS